ncbi:MAG: hydroxysqualene dehydroxylase HpnE [Betaproteobacteria bacterium]
MADAARGTGTPARIAVVGGGWAGCAAAVTLASAGIAVTLIEQAKTLGGRARRVIVDDVALDNGQHLIIGAYRQTLELIEAVHGAERTVSLFRRLPLTLRPFGSTNPDAVEFRAWRAPAPWHLAGALLATRGLSVAERIALLVDYRRIARAGFRCASGQTVAECFARTPARPFAAFWVPLCLAALNTPPDAASAQIFAEVLRAAFAGTARDSDFLVPRVDLTACFPDAAARQVAERGGIVRLGVTVRAIARDGIGAALAIGERTETFDAVIVAVGPHQLAATLGEDAARDSAWGPALAQVSAFAYESITTIYLAFTKAIPFPVPLLRLDDAPGHWAFDRSDALLAGDDAKGLVAVVISAGGPHDHLDHPALAKAAEAQMRRLSPNLPLVAWSRVIAERRATYACRPALSRPVHGKVAGSLYLAGDYTDADFPATLEAATRSGVAAARALIAERGDRAR